MALTILHLYADFLSLYGEYGNLFALQRLLDDSGVATDICTQSITDTLDFTDVQLIYIGAGTEQRQAAALAHLMQHRDALHAAVENGATLLCTGNAMELLGQHITTRSGDHLPALGFGAFSATQTDTRFMGDIVARHTALDTPVVGYINRCSEITGVTTPLFRVHYGFGNTQADKAEGYRAGRVFGTQLLGPLLVKNPAFLSWFAGQLLPQVTLAPPEAQAVLAYEETRRSLEARAAK